MIVGETILPYEWIAINYKKNKSIIENRLNEADAFDIPLSFKVKDQLEIVFNNNDYYKREVYGFKYVKGKWKIAEIDSFYLMGHCDEIAFGKIKNK